MEEYNKSIKALEKLTLELNEKDEKLKSSEKRFRSFFSLSNVPMIIADNNRDGVFVEVNKAFADLLGYEIEELVEHHYSEFIDSTILEENERLVQYIKENQVPTDSFINHYISKDGKKLTLLWNGTSPDENGLVYFIAQDITDKIQNEVNLLVSEEKFKNFFNLSNVPLAIANSSNGWFLEVNDAFSELLGYEKSEMTFVDYTKFIVPEEIVTSEKALESLYQNKKDINNFLNKYIKKNGEIVTLLWSVSSPVDHNGTVFCVAHNVTEGRNLMKS